jgi:hypothetical protein
MNTMAPVNSSFLKYEEGENQYSRQDITVVSGQNLAAGTVLGVITASGKYTAYDNDAVDGSAVAAGVLYAAVNATSADTAGVAIVRHAVVAKEGLIWGAGVTTQGEKDAAYVDLKAIGIVTRTAV